MQLQYQSLELQLQSNSINHFITANIYYKIAITYSYKCFNEVLAYLFECLEIKKNNYVNNYLNNIEIAKTYSAIRTIYG